LQSFAKKNETDCAGELDKASWKSRQRETEPREEKESTLCNIGVSHVVFLSALGTMHHVLYVLQKASVSSCSLLGLEEDRMSLTG